MNARTPLANVSANQIDHADDDNTFVQVLSRTGIAIALNPHTYTMSTDESGNSSIPGMSMKRLLPTWQQSPMRTFPAERMVCQGLYLFDSDSATKNRCIGFQSQFKQSMIHMNDAEFNHLKHRHEEQARKPTYGVIWGKTMYRAIDFTSSSSDETETPPVRLYQKVSFPYRAQTLGSWFFTCKKWECPSSPSGKFSRLKFEIMGFNQHMLRATLVVEDHVDVILQARFDRVVHMWSHLFHSFGPSYQKVSV